MDDGLRPVASYSYSNWWDKSEPWGLPESDRAGCRLEVPCMAVLLNWPCTDDIVHTRDAA